MVQMLGKPITRIILVDDEAYMTTVFKCGLESYGFEVDAFTDPEEALEEYQPGKHDMLIRRKNAKGHRIWTVPADKQSWWQDNKVHGKFAKVVLPEPRFPELYRKVNSTWPIKSYIRMFQMTEIGMAQAQTNHQIRYTLCPNCHNGIMIYCYTCTHYHEKCNCAAPMNELDKK